MLYVSVSDFLHWRKCAYACHFRVTEGLWSAPTAALTTGDYFHRYMHWLEHPRIQPDPRFPVGPRPPSPDPATPQEEAVDNAITRLTASWQPAYVPRALEYPIQYRLTDGVTLVGRPDGIGTDSDQVAYLIQYKSIGFNRAVAFEAERVRLSPHELTYAAILHEMGVPTAGTWLTVWRKPPPTARARAEGSVGTLHSLPLQRPSGGVLDGLWPPLRTQLRAFAQSLVLSLSEQPRDFTACFGQFGNGPLCPLYSHCHNGLDARTLDGLAPTVSTEQRYADLLLGADPGGDTGGGTT